MGFQNQQSNFKVDKTHFWDFNLPINEKQTQRLANFEFLNFHGNCLPIRNIPIFEAFTILYATKIRVFLIFVAGTNCTYNTKIRFFLTFVMYTQFVPTTKIREKLIFVGA